jgi:hypothetical protein
MDYDTLILSLLADRLDFLLARRADTVRHLAELVETRTLFDLMPRPAACAKRSLAMTELVADINVMALGATRKTSEADTSDHNPARSLSVDAA